MKHRKTGFVILSAALLFSSIPYSIIHAEERDPYDFEDPNDKELEYYWNEVMLNWDPWQDDDPWDPTEPYEVIETDDYNRKYVFNEDAVVPGYIRMFRLYNPNSGEHFYTAKAKERDVLIKTGWKYEGIGWMAPEKSKTPVYRLYNKYGGEHHYTMKSAEKDALVKIGWTYEGVGWYSDDKQSVSLFREYNPNMKSCNHNYTVNQKEHDALTGKLGWTDEGIGWYGIAPPEGSTGIVRMDPAELEKEVSSILLPLSNGDYDGGFYHSSSIDIYSFFSPTERCQFNLIEKIANEPSIADFSLYNLKGIKTVRDGKKSDPKRKYVNHGELAVSDVRWVASKIFHLEDSRIDYLIQEAVDRKSCYVYKDKLYFPIKEEPEEKRCIQLAEVKSDGEKYYVWYDSLIPLEDGRHDLYGDGGAVIANELIDGKYYWTVYRSKLFY